MKTVVIENFLSNNEIIELEKTFRHRQDTVVWIEKNFNPEPYSHAHYWYPGPSYQSEICENINKKINQYFVNNVCDNWHILNAFIPYGIHTDSLDDEVQCDTHSQLKNFNFGYTFLIPLADYDASTIVFNEKAPNMKVSTKWIERENRQPLNLISDEIYENYLTHQSKELVNYFSIDTIFEWKKGNLLAMDRASFHCSSNFIKNELLEKRALVGWSLIPLTDHD